jgi:hypothetical protein
MVEAASLGMPLEVWKTHMGRFRNETTMQAFVNIYKNSGGGIRGVAAFWKGTSAKVRIAHPTHTHTHTHTLSLTLTLTHTHTHTHTRQLVESASKGSVLMFSKEMIKDSCLAMGMSPSTSGFLAGAGGGVCQVSVMGPCTYLVTALVTGDKSVTLSQRIVQTFRTQGVQGFYPGGVPIAFRQATNWASRQGFTDAVREAIKRVRHENPATAKLSVGEEVTAGIIGGTLSCWNHPFEVARIEAQSRAVAGQEKISMVQIFRNVMGEHGVQGLFKVGPFIPLALTHLHTHTHAHTPMQGVIPRIMLGIWQTTFMVTGANLIRDHIFKAPGSGGH